MKISNFKFNKLCTIIFIYLVKLDVYSILWILKIEQFSSNLHQYFFLNTFKSDIEYLFLPKENILKFNVILASNEKIDK